MRTANATRQASPEWRYWRRLSYIGFLAVLGRLYARSLRMLGDNEHPAAGIILQRLEQQAICMAGPEISLERGKVFFSFQKIECPHLPHAISSTALKIGAISLSFLDISASCLT